MAELYRYSFLDNVATEDVESALLLAVFGAEALHGESQVQLDAARLFDQYRRICVIDAATDVGRDLNRLFVGFLRREVEADSFRVGGSPLWLIPRV